MEQAGDYRRYKTILLALTAVVFIWGVIGALDIKNIPYTGYQLSPSNQVIAIRDGSPAEQAGLKAGDTVTRIDNIPVENFGGLFYRERPAVGSQGSLTVKRGEEAETLNLTYGSQPSMEVVAGFGALTLIGLAFLILGLMVYLKNPTRLSTSFCTLSLLFAISLLNRPYLPGSIQRRLVDAGLAFVLAILMAVILDYCLRFPNAKKIIATRAWPRQAIYIVAGAWGIMTATITLTTPMLNVTRVQLLQWAFGLIVGGYLLLAVIAVIHSYLKATSEQRGAWGLNMLLLGMVIGFGPITLLIIARTIAQEMSELPGERFYIVTMIAIPIGMAMALMRREPAQAAIKVVEQGKAS